MPSPLAFQQFLLSTLLVIATFGSAMAGTIVHIGEIREFNGPDDLNLDPNRVIVAIDCFGDSDRLVNGVLFETDKSPPAGVTVTASNSINNWATRPSYSGADATSVDNLEQIMRDIRWEAAPSPLLVTVSGLVPGIEYELQMLFNEGGDRNRRWDIAIEGQLAVDDFSSEGEGSWSPSNGVAYIGPFNLAPGDTVLNVEMRQHIGGQSQMGSDNNPILQAFTITEITIPPTPESLALSPTEFFAVQTAAIGTLATVDLKRNSTHLYSFAAGGPDNDKFEIDGDQLLPGPYDFTVHAPGTTFDVRVRTTDADDPARFLEKDFVLTLAQALAPTGISLSATSISSGAIVGTPVGQLTTTDASNADAHTYALVPGNGDDGNGLFTIDGAWLRLAVLIPGNLTEVSVRIRSTDLAGLSFEWVFSLDVTEPSLRINELMASNGSTLDDEDGEASDWVEIFNEQGGAANMNGWYLTDDPNDLTKWQFPAITIAANDYLVIFASGKDRTPANGDNLHTSFQLGSGGEYLALVEPDGTTIADQIDFPEQHPDISYGHNLASTEIGYLQVATPNGPNSDTSAQILNEATFSTERGFYSGAFDLTLTATIPGSTIRYTTNGSKPSASSGSIYAGPIAITPETGSSTRGTRRVRAIAIHPTAALTPVATHTYIFVNGTGNPLTNGVLGQSNFQSSIKNHPTYGPLMDDGLLALPAISIVKPSGISGSEGETSIELISVDGSEAGFQIDCGIKIVGGASVGSPKNNFRCYFRSQYGSAKLRYPLYANHPYTKGASEEFDVIQLRSGSHDNFFWMARPSNPPIGFRHGDAQYIRNRFTWDAEMLMGHPSLHGRWAHCYLNGAYHGIYHIHERPMHNYLDKYFGGDPEDYHYTNSARNGSDHGGGDTWSSTWQQVKRAASAGGQQSKDWINWESLADNQLLYFYFGNDWDWTTNHNWMAAGPQNPGEGGWRFYSWDCDVSMYDIAANNLNQNAPDGVFNSMMNDPDFKVFFRDRVYKHCFHGGVLRPDGLRAAHDYRMNELFEAIVPETARWQPSSSTSAPWDRDGEWQTEWNYMKNVYWPRRTAILLNQIRSRGWYPVEAPEFTPHGGNVASGFSPIINGSGTIYVTTDGSDPRLPGGAVNPEAQAFTGSSVNTTLVSRGSMWKFLDDGTDFATTAWRQPAYDDSAWVEDDAEFGYGDGDEATVVSYGPFSSEKYITTYFRKKFNVANVAAVSSLVLELKRDDGAVVYINGTEVWRANMEEGIVIGPDTLAFVGQREPEENSFFLKNDVPPAVLVDGENTIAVEVHQILQTSSDLSFDFSLTASVPSDPSQLALNESTVMKSRVLQGGQWSPLNEVVFTIGDAADATNLVVSEFSYRPSKPTPAEDPGDIYSRTDFEFVELMNIAPGQIHLNDVRFTDGISFDFAGNPAIALDPGERVLIVEHRDAFQARYPGVSVDRIAGEYDNNLSNDGEHVEIIGTADAVIRSFTYNDKAPWPEAADGDGYSLELIAPSSNPDHDVATNWRASHGIHGTPDGIWTALDFLGWQAFNFTAAELADPLISGPNANQDHDGLTNFAEFALGTAPDDSITRAMLPTASVVEDGGQSYLALTYSEWLGALGVTYEMERSTDLVSWQSGPAALVEVGAAIDNGDGTITRTFRSTTPLTNQLRQFMRLKMSN